MATDTPRSGTPDVRGHVVALDGLRFLAAAVVLVGHCFNVIAIPESVQKLVRETPLVVFINGYGAVHLFFVLSGFVLAGSADRVRERIDLVQFYVRRVLRIHPPYVYALVVAWLASFVYDVSQSAGAVTPYLMKRASVHLTPEELVSFFLYPSDAKLQLGPAWTLAIEMHFSFLLPLMLWVTRRSHWSVLIVLSLFALFDGHRLWEPIDYAIFFSLGVAIFQERDRLQRLADALSSAVRFVAVGASLLVFAAPWLLDIVYEAGFAYSPWGTAVSAVGAGLLLWNSLCFDGVSRLLAHPSLAYGGRISYSFYLLHYPVMILCSQTLRAPLTAFDTVAYLASVFLLTFGAAALSFYVIERPSIRAGNALCRAISRRTSATPQFSRLGA